jgi:hypothetical protein
MGKLCSVHLISPSVTFFLLHNCYINQPVSQCPVNLTSTHRVFMRHCQQTLFLDIGLLSPKSFPLFQLPLLFSTTPFLGFVFYVIQILLFCVRGILPECTHSTHIFEVLSARGAYPTFSWFLAIAVLE